MQIQISGHHVDVTQPLKDHVEEKFGKLEEHFKHITNVHVTLTVEKSSKESQRQIASAEMHLSGKQIRASSTTDDMYSSIDDLTNKLHRQVIKHKEIMKKHDRDSDELL